VNTCSPSRLLRFWAVAGVLTFAVSSHDDLVQQEFIRHAKFLTLTSKTLSIVTVNGNSTHAAGMPTAVSPQVAPYADVIRRVLPDVGTYSPAVLTDTSGDRSPPFSLPANDLHCEAGRTQQLS
jgi:hypothetical protein